MQKATPALALLRGPLIWSLILLGLILSAFLLWPQSGAPALFKAMEARDLSRVQAIVKQHPGQVNQEFLGRRPLHLAVGINRLDFMKILVQNGARPNDGDSYQNTALHVALFCFRDHLAIYLLRIGADPNAANYFGDTPLHYAAWLGVRKGTVRVLLAKGADPKRRNHAGRTALDMARQRHPAIYRQISQWLSKRSRQRSVPQQNSSRHRAAGE